MIFKMSWFRRNFIPSKSNAFRPNILQTAAVVGMVVLVLISFAIANFQSLIWVTSEWLVSAVLPAIVADATNEARTEEALTPLTRSAVLDRAAELKAKDMADNNYFAHWSPAGLSPWHWFEEAGYRYIHAGENLAVHFTDSNAVVEAWLNSPSHRQNILNSNYTEIGIGTATGKFEGHDTVFVVQLFGTPNPAQVSVQNPLSQSVIEEVAATPGVPTVAGTESGEVDVSVTDEGTVVYESHTAVSYLEVSSSAPTSAATVETKAEAIGRLATSPRLFLQIAYSLIGLFVLGALLVSAVIEWRRQHPVQIAYSVALIVLMIALFRVHMAISGGVVIA